MRSELVNPPFMWKYDMLFDTNVMLTSQRSMVKTSLIYFCLCPDKRRCRGLPTIHCNMLRYLTR